MGGFEFMKRKNVYVVLIAGMFLLVSIASFLVTGVEKLENSCRIKYLLSGKSAANFGGDRLDQHQTECNDGIQLYIHKIAKHHWIYGYAQSFTPDIHSKVITRVKLYVAKVGDPQRELFLGIGKFKPNEGWPKLRGVPTSVNELDVYTAISPVGVPRSYSWIEFDFPDIEVNSSYTYYIGIIRPIGFEEPGYNATNCYSIGYFNNRHVFRHS